MSNNTTSKLSCSSGTTLSALVCVIVLFSVFIRQEIQHIALESRVSTIEIAVADALQIRLIHVSANEDSTQNTKEVVFDHLDEQPLRYQRSLSSPNTSSIQNEVTTQIRHVFSTMMNTFCARDEKLCLQGPKGDIGIPGPRGPTGRPGATGIRGRQGFHGKQGPRGPKGELGNDGEKGEKGDPGKSIFGPKITSPPTSSTVREHTVALFRCKAEGLPLPAVAWARAGASLPSDRHVIQADNTLVIKNVTYDDHGRYTCSASSMLGNESVSAHLTVQVPVKIAQGPKSLVLEEGGNLTFTCTAIGHPQPRITWEKLGSTMDTRRLIVTGNNFTIKTVKVSDFGTYSCRAENAINFVTALASVIVVPRLRFTTSAPNNVTFLAEEPFILHCQADSANFPVAITWSRVKGGRLSSRHRTPANGSLVVKKASEADRDIYTCTARNIVASLSFNVSVNILVASSCSEIRQAGFVDSRTYSISPSGLAPFTVLCDMRDKKGVGVTVISHDSETRTLVEGFEVPGSFKRNINYSGYTKQQLVGLIAASTNCEQLIKYECYSSVLLHSDVNDYAWWVSRDGVKMNYWGGAPPWSAKCACGVTKSCSLSNKPCNCDSNDSVWREDSGLLTDKSTLPVSQLRFGDTGDKGEKGYYTLGKLRCYNT